MCSFMELQVNNIGKRMWNFSEEDNKYQGILIPELIVPRTSRMRSKEDKDSLWENLKNFDNKEKFLRKS